MLVEDEIVGKAGGNLAVCAEYQPAKCGNNE